VSLEGDALDRRAIFVATEVAVTGASLRLTSQTITVGFFPKVVVPSRRRGEVVIGFGQPLYSIVMGIYNKYSLSPTFACETVRTKRVQYNGMLYAGKPSSGGNRETLPPYVGSSKNLGGLKVQKVPRQVRKCCFYTVLNPKICLRHLSG